MRLSDQELQKELESYRAHVRLLRLGKAPKNVILKGEIQLEILEELVMWRSNGRKWLELLNGKHDSNAGKLSETIMVKENHVTRKV